MKLDIEIDDLDFGDLHFVRSKIEAIVDKAVRKAVQKVMAEHPVIKAVARLRTARKAHRRRGVCIPCIVEGAVDRLCERAARVRASAN